MKEISLHIMDIAQNSITADATLIEVEIDIQYANNMVSVTMKDNGRGMGKDMLAQVTNPFVTTRTTRRVGMGISLFQAGTQASDGEFSIDSTEGVGTVIQATYRLDHLDRPPIGDFAGTMHTLIVSNPDIDFLVAVIVDGTRDVLDTREVRQALGDDVPLDMPDVSMWIKENLEEMFKPEYVDF